MERCTALPGPYNTRTLVQSVQSAPEPDMESQLGVERHKTRGRAAEGIVRGLILKRYRTGVVR